MNGKKYKEDKIVVVKFQGGLGNQMFQYSLYKKLEHLGRNVIADISWYETWNKKFELLDVFPNVSIRIDEDANLTDTYKMAQKQRSIFEKIIHKAFPNFQYRLNEKQDGTYQKEVLSYKRGILDGYWQTAEYWKDIEEQVVSDFEFNAFNQSKELSKIMKCYDVVSVHIRRGDYLLPENQELFGEICTEDYYEKAMRYMREKVPNVRFLFFTNDPDWVKEKFKISDGYFINDYYGEEVSDCYDMFMMSQCKHHIIANSTFSWWGAYLGNNKDKIVIAPSKWMNNRETKDIYQPEWLKL